MLIQQDAEINIEIFTDTSRNASGGKSFNSFSLRSNCCNLLSFENGREDNSFIMLLARCSVLNSWNHKMRMELIKYNWTKSEYPTYLHVKKHSTWKAFDLVSW